MLSGELDSHFTSLNLLTQLNLLPSITEYVVVVVVVMMMMDTPDHPPE